MERPTGPRQTSPERDQRPAAGVVVTKRFTVPSALRLRSTSVVPPLGPVVSESTAPSAPRVRSTVATPPLAIATVLSIRPSAPRARSVRRLAVRSGQGLVHEPITASAAVDRRGAALRSRHRLIGKPVRAARAVGRRDAAPRANHRLVHQSLRPPGSGPPCPPPRSGHARIGRSGAVAIAIHRGRAAAPSGARRIDAPSAPRLRCTLAVVGACCLSATCRWTRWRASLEFTASASTAATASAIRRKSSRGTVAGDLVVLFIVLFIVRSQSLTELPRRVARP